VGVGTAASRAARRRRRDAGDAWTCFVLVTLNGATLLMDPVLGKCT
jgi:hypothetical protein